MTKKTGWIGLGKMGAPMALNIQRSGCELTVWNRSAGRSDDLRAAGAQIAGDIQELATAVDTLFVMVSDDVALGHVLLGPEGALAHMHAGCTLVEMSTVSVAFSSKIAAAAKARGVRYLRAPVSGSVTLATAATLTILASGPRGVYDALLPVLETMSAQQFYVGEGEHARVLKLAINMMVGLSAAMMGEALALGSKGGLDRTTMLEVIGASVVASPLIEYKLEALKARDYSPKFEVAQMAKDFDLILEAARNTNTPMPLAALVREEWSALSAAGDGAEDFFKYIELAAQKAGVTET